MAIQKTVKSRQGVDCDYHVITDGVYLEDGQRFQVRVGMYINSEHYNEPGSSPIDWFDSAFDCAYSASDPVGSAEQELITRFDPFIGGTRV